MIKFYGDIDGKTCFETENNLLRIDIKAIYEGKEGIEIIQSKKNGGSTPKLVTVKTSYTEDGEIKLEYYDKTLLNDIKTCLEEHEGMEVIL